jgi:hypothetical protein
MIFLRQLDLKQQISFIALILLHCPLHMLTQTRITTILVSNTTDYFDLFLHYVLFFGGGRRKGTRVWTQGLHLEPLHQPFFMIFFFRDRVSQSICPGWLPVTVLLISASWVVRITGWITGTRNFVCLWDRGLNSRLYTCKAGTLMLKPCLQSFLPWLLWRWEFYKLFA